MHVRGEGSRSNYPVGGNAVGRRVEPKGGNTKLLVSATTLSHTPRVHKGFIKRVVLTRSVRLGWGHM